MTILDNLRAQRDQRQAAIDAAATDWLNDIREPSPEARAGDHPYQPLPARKLVWRDLANPAEQQLTHADELAYLDEQDDQ